MAEIVAIQYPVYLPAMRVITAITRAPQAAVTTSFAHDYGVGEIVKILIPKGFGMFQINKRTGTITAVTSTTFTLDIDSSEFNAFAIPAGNTQYAQVVDVGEVNSTFDFASQNVLPRSAA